MVHIGLGQQNTLSDVVLPVLPAALMAEILMTDVLQSDLRVGVSALMPAGRSALAMRL